MPQFRPHINNPADPSYLKDQPNQIQPEQSDQSPVDSSNKDDDQRDIIQCLASFFSLLSDHGTAAMT